MKPSAAFALSLLFSGCASMNSRNIPFMRDSVSENLGGFNFERVQIFLSGLGIANKKPEAEFMQFVSLLPGDDLRKAYQPAQVAVNDSVIGFNGKVYWDSAQALSDELNNNYCKENHPLVQIFSARNQTIQNIVACDKHTLGNFGFRFEAVMINGLKITSIDANSWAAKYDLRKGDVIIGVAKLQSATLRRSWIPFVSRKRNEIPAEEIFANNEFDFLDLLYKMFFNIKPYQPTREGRDGLLGYSTVLQLDLIRNGQLVHKDLARERYVGLGIGLSCPTYCAQSSPIVGGIAPNSAGARAGFQIGDILLSINEKEVKNSWAAKKIIGKLDYGKTAACRVMRNKELVDITAKIDWVIEN